MVTSNPQQRTLLAFFGEYKETTYSYPESDQSRNNYREQKYQTTTCQHLEADRGAIKLKTRSEIQRTIIKIITTLQHRKKSEGK